MSTTDDLIGFLKKHGYDKVTGKPRRISFTFNNKIRISSPLIGLLTTDDCPDADIGIYGEEEYLFASFFGC